MQCVQQEEGELGKICENLTTVYVSHSATLFIGCLVCVLVKVVLGHNQDAVKCGGGEGQKTGRGEGEM